MDVTASVATRSSVDDLFALVSELDRYPAWLDIVARAEAVPVDAGDPGPAWLVDLRGQIGPLRRTKRLRMVRTVAEVAGSTGRVTFERCELDGRDHSAWVLGAAIADRPAGAELTMSLHYGGSLWIPILDRLLADEIERSRTRLLAVLEAG